MSKRVSFYVNKYIEGDPTIKVGLQRGLITSRILTKHIIEEEHEFKGSFDDVRNAVRRYSDEKVPLFDFKNAYIAFKSSYVDVKSKLAFIEIARKQNDKDIPKMIGGLSTNSDKFIRISNNKKSLIVTVREDDLNEIIKSIKKEEVIDVQKGITSITAYLDPSVKFTPGVYFLIMGQISLNQINICDVSSYKNEFTLYVNQEDGAKVHNLLHELIEYQQKFCSTKG